MFLQNERSGHSVKQASELSPEESNIGMSDGVYHIILPDHKRLNPYTLKAIIKDAGLTDEELKNCFRPTHPYFSIPTFPHSFGRNYHLD